MALTWEAGQQAQLAKAAGIKPRSLEAILRGRRRARPELAKVLAENAQSMGLDLERFDFLYPEESLSPLIEC